MLATAFEIFAELACLAAGVLVVAVLVTGGATSAPALAAGCALALCVAAIPYFMASMAHRSAERQLLKDLINRLG